MEPNITAMTFSKNGEYLVIGYLNGNFEIHKYNREFSQIFTGNINKLNYKNNKVNSNIGYEEKY